MWNLQLENWIFQWIIEIFQSIEIGFILIIVNNFSVADEVGNCLLRFNLKWLKFNMNNFWLFFTKMFKSII